MQATTVVGAMGGRIDTAVAFAKIAAARKLSGATGKWGLASQSSNAVAVCRRGPKQ
jgi:thiamine pyrophosphokinase